MGGKPFANDLATERAALTSSRAEWIDAGAWLGIWLVMLAVAWITGR